MAEEKGKLITCNRCNETLFLKLIRTETLDGGFGDRYDKFENLPDEWLYQTEIGHLCPGCAASFRCWITTFMEGKVANKWKYEIEECDLNET